MTVRLPKPLPTIEYLRECFDYDPGTGELRWIMRPRSHFSSNSRWKHFGEVFVGRVAGRLNSRGYRRVTITLDGSRYDLGRYSIAWAMVKGEWPLNGLDHRNRVRGDDRLGNLREATPREQNQNRGLQLNSTSGFMGVSRRGNKWEAQIMVDGRGYYLGRFPTPEAASAAYLEAKKRYHLYQPIPRAA